MVAGPALIGRIGPHERPAAETGDRPGADHGRRIQPHRHADAARFRPRFQHGADAHPHARQRLPGEPAGRRRQQRQSDQRRQEPGAAPAQRQQQRGRGQARQRPEPGAAAERPVERRGGDGQEIERHQPQGQPGFGQEQQGGGHRQEHRQDVGEMVGAQVGAAGAQAVLFRTHRPQHHPRAVHVLHRGVEACERNREQQDEKQPPPAAPRPGRLRPGPCRRGQARPAQRFPARRVGHRRRGNAQRHVGRQRGEDPESGRRNRARRHAENQRPAQHQQGAQKRNRQARREPPGAGGAQQPHAPRCGPHQQQHRQAVVDPRQRRRALRPPFVPARHADTLPARTSSAALR